MSDPLPPNQLQPEIHVSHAPETSIRTPVDKAIHLLITRNLILNSQNSDLHLPTVPTEKMQETAKSLVIFQDKLKQSGGETVVAAFYSEPYNITWLEQILPIDPKKVAIAIDTKLRVDSLGASHKYEQQYLPALSLGSYVAIEKLDDLGLTYAPTRTAIEQIQKKLSHGGPRGQQALLNHLVDYLTDVQKIDPRATGKERSALLIEEISDTIHKRLVHASRVDKILEQSQGVEVEVLQRLENVPPEMRTNADIRYRLERAERLGIAETWLPRGVRIDQHTRMDWHLTNMLGLPEDIAEKKTEWFEMTAKPTSFGSAQSTILYELTLGGFINENILSNTWEKYSLHTSTTFPASIWDYNRAAQMEYKQCARGFAGAFASLQRGVYGGYIYYDRDLGEIYDKSFEPMKFRTIPGTPQVSISDQRLVEIRCMDITPEGQYAFELRKPYMDFSFKCYWLQQGGNPLKNAAEYQAANLWSDFMGELRSVNKKYGVEDAWWGTGWKKVSSPQLQKDLAALYRNYSSQIQRVAEQEVQLSTETLYAQTDVPVTLVGERKFMSEPTSTIEKHQNTITLSPSDAEQCHLVDGQNITFRFGEYRTSSRVVVSKDPSSSDIHLLKGTTTTIDIPESTSLSLRYDHIRNELVAGPVIGIPATIEDSSLAQPFGAQTEYHASVIREAQKRGIFVYSFDPRAVNTTDHTIDGLTLDTDGKTWKRITMPYPDLQFDRNFGELPENNRLALSHIPAINSREFVLFLVNKLDLMNLHRSNELLRAYVPETVAFTGPQSIEAMLEKHPTIYLKPQFGMKSIGIVKITRNSENTGYIYNFTKPQQDPDSGEWYYSWSATQGDYAAQTIGEILQQTQAIRSEYRDYIIQQGVDMARDPTDGDFMEMRFLFQRTKSGALELIGWHEGQNEYWQRNFARLFGEQNADIVMQNTESLASAFALNTQRNIGNHFGQMTVQVAVDNHGKPWLLEQNPLPGVMNQFNFYGHPELTDRSAEQLMEYAQSSAGFSEQPCVVKSIETYTLPSGQNAEIYEEQNPFVIYHFAQQALKAGITKPETSVYNLFSHNRIQENIADGTRYIMLRSEGKIIGCISILKPKEGYMVDTDDPEHNWVDTRMRWEIGGVLTIPEARGQGVAKKLFDICIKEIQKTPPVKNEGLTEKLGHDVFVDEIRVCVTGTYNPNNCGIARDDSKGIERIVQNYPGNRTIGAVPNSYGPIYTIPIASQKQT